MRWFLRGLSWLPIALAAGCLDLAEEGTIPADAFEPGAGGMFDPCEDYALDENPSRDQACFTWATLRCAGEAEADACEAAVDIPSPSGNLQCVWTDSLVFADVEAQCEEREAPFRCIAAVGIDPECEGAARWSRPDPGTADTWLVELDCAFMPVPDFEPCDAAADELCC